MAGGLLNLVSTGQQNIILNGNPEKTFWKAAFKKYTNFGKQNFTLNYEGTPQLSLTNESTFVFKVKRYADLLMDCYISIDMPTIWSPVLPPQEIIQPDGSIKYTNWSPYEFRWIENLGAQMIERITITCGNQKLQEYSGRYILTAMQRDFGGTKRLLFDVMTGQVPDMVNPAFSHSNKYPNAFYTPNPAGAQPSINGRTLLIPLGAWFNYQGINKDPSNSFPLVALQYNELQISVTFRPINQLFRIRDVMDYNNNYPYVAPNFNQYYMQFYRFLQTPPDETLGPTSYIDTRTTWKSNINLNCMYCFLSNDESKIFAKNEQKYLITQIYEKPYYNITNQNKVQLDSLGMVRSWMFYFQRSDVNLRNEWSNWSNWEYNGVMPFNNIPAPTSGDYPNPDPSGPPLIGPGTNPTGSASGLQITGNYNQANQKEILISLGILIDGQYRENMLPSGVYNFVEKYLRTNGFADQGLYCYNFCLNASDTYQPSGAINMSRFTTIEFEFSTINPPVDPYAQVLTICDPNTGEVVGINKPSWRIYKYNYDLYVMEERVNMVIFVGGNAGLLYAT